MTIQYKDGNNTIRHAEGSHAGNSGDPDVSFETLSNKIGEVQASPTANTVLDRLKAIATALAGTLTIGGSVTANAGTNLNTSALLTEADFDTKTGSLTETAPGSDTASSGLNGRLQRIAQRITSLIALLPASLGQKTMANSLAVTLASDQDIRESWRISTLSFTTTDDSDTIFTVPADTEYQILSVYISLTTTSTAGNRQMAVQALDGSDNILIGARARVTQAASLTRVYNFAPGLPNDGGFYDTDYLAVSLPPIFLAAGQKLRVWDKAAIAAAADDMVVRVQIASRSIA